MIVTPMIVTPTGHAPDVWAPTLAAAPSLGVAELVDLLHPGAPATLLVVGAHPDDETLGLGRLAHHWAGRVGPVLAMVATAGEACVDHVLPRPAGLADRRIAEWHRALDRLGVADRWVLGLADGRVADEEDAVAAVIADRAARYRNLVLAAPWRHDPHPDHRAIGRAAARVADQLAVTLIEFPVWMTYWSDPGSVEAADQQVRVVTTEPEDAQARDDALAAFASQLEPLHPDLGPVLPPAMLAHQPDQLVILASTLTTTARPERRP